MQNKNIETELSNKTPEKSLTKRQKLIASLLLGVGIVVGGHSFASKANSEQQFVDSKQNTPTVEQAYAITPPNSVEGSIGYLKPEPGLPKELVEPSPVAIKRIEVPTSTKIEKTVNKPEPTTTTSDAEYMKGYWERFEKKHANDEAPTVPNITGDSSVSADKPVETQATTTTNIDPESTNTYWGQFEKRHANDAAPTAPNVTVVDSPISADK